MRIIPDGITVTGGLLGPLARMAVPALHDSPLLLSATGVLGGLPGWVILRADAFIASVFSVIVGGGTIYLLGVAGKAIFKKDAMGGGDVKLMAMVGGLCGWTMVTLAFFIAPFIAIPFGIVSMIKTKDNVIPYGPFLSAAVVAVMIWKGPLFEWIMAHLAPVV